MVNFGGSTSNSVFNYRHDIRMFKYRLYSYLTLKSPAKNCYSAWISTDWIKSFSRNTFTTISFNFLNETENSSVNCANHLHSST